VKIKDAKAQARQIVVGLIKADLKKNSTKYNPKVTAALFAWCDGVQMPPVVTKVVTVEREISREEAIRLEDARREHELTITRERAHEKASRWWTGVTDYARTHTKAQVLKWADEPFAWFHRE